MRAPWVRAAAKRPAPAQVRAGDGRVRADAAVNSGNALAAAAEAERAVGGAGGRPHSLLSAAAGAYRAALAQEEDALVRPSGGLPASRLPACCVETSGEPDVKVCLFT